MNMKLNKNTINKVMWFQALSVETVNNQRSYIFSGTGKLLKVITFSTRTEAGGVWPELIFLDYNYPETKFPNTNNIFYNFPEVYLPFYIFPEDLHPPINIFPKILYIEIIYLYILYILILTIYSKTIFKK